MAASMLGEDLFYRFILAEEDVDVDSLPLGVTDAVPASSVVVMQAAVPFAEVKTPPWKRRS